MCGLAGVFSTYLTDKDCDVFRQLLIVAALRGWHSTGTAIIGKEEYRKPMEGAIHKEVGDPFHFFRSTGFEEDLKRFKNKRALIGHARYATKGEVNKDNAHPFVATPKESDGGDSIVGVHNGTIWGDFDHKDAFATDSQALYQNIAEKGVSTALQHLEDKGGGAYALVFWDEADNTLNFIRNTQRDLYIAVGKSGTVMYWASEKMMLEMVLKRMNQSYEDPFLLKPNTLLSIEIEKTDCIKKWEVIPDIVTPRPFVSTFTPKDGEDGWVWHANKNGNGGYYTREKKTTTTILPPTTALSITTSGSGTSGITNTGTSTRNPDGTSTQAGGKTQQTSVVPYVPRKPKEAQHRSYTGYKGVALSLDYADKLLNRGCIYCTNPADRADAVRWINASEFACEDCKEDKFVLEFIKSRGNEPMWEQDIHDHQ